MQIAPLLNIGRGVTALIGGGGKTTLLYTLTEELRKKGTVLLCTSTHIMRPTQYEVLERAGEAEISAALSAHGAVCVGEPSAEGKLGPPSLSFDALARLADYVLVEADGSRRLPLKAHAPHEPVIPANAQRVVLVVGADGFGSFTKAAEVLGYTQSGLTHMMNSLEKEVGFTLLERGRSGVRLTEEGERIAPAVREFLQANARLDSVIEQVASSRTEIIRVSAYASIAMHWLPGIIQRFREECPDVDVDIRMADHVDVPYELLAQGKMDAILVSPQDEGRYEWVHLADDPMFAVLPRDFDTQGMTAFPLAAFEARDFIMPSQGFDKDIMRIFNRIGVKPHILPTWVDDPTVISMVSHGLGVSMMTELTVRGRTDGVKLLPVEPASSRELGLAVRSLDAASDGLRHFIDCTKRVVAEMQP